MKKEIIYWAKRAYNKDLSPATSGNISCVDIDNKVLITSSGSSFADLEEDDIVKVDKEGNIIEGIKKPSSEKNMHLLIYKKRPDIKAIIHCHCPYITAFAVSNKEINEVIMPEFGLYFGSIPISKYFLPSSYELAQNVSDLFKNKNAVLMKNHGIIVGSKSLKEAFYMLESINAYSKTYIFSKIISSPKSLNKKQIKEIEKLKN